MRLSSIASIALLRWLAAGGMDDGAAENPHFPNRLVGRQKE
jgi:hypothetical protein